jgi:hypothetical protein
MAYRGLDSVPPDDLPAHTRYLKSIRDVFNTLLIGKQNVTLDFTLTPSASSSTVQDPRIGGTSAILLMPETANAAAALATTYIPPATITSQQAIIQHANNAQADRTFRLVIIG